jgi:hypothetical protein
MQVQVMFTAIIQGGGLAGQLGQSAEEPKLYHTGFFGSDLRHLVEVFSQRYERGSILVTFNLPFDE